MAKLNNNNKDVIETMAQLLNTNGINLGTDEVEFPDGTKEKFIYNGEEDRQAAINFAQICFNATNDTKSAKQRMAICYALLIKGITPTEETVLGDGGTYYIDHKRKLLCNKYGNIIVELEEDEKVIEDKLAITRLLQERAERKIWANEEEEW